MALKKRGLSTVVATLLLILLAIILIATLWGVVRPLVENRLDESKVCLDVMGKVTLNDRYTCYNRTMDAFLFSINVDDLDIDKVIVSISSQGQGKSIELTNSLQTITNFRNYNGTTQVVLPGKNSGLTYVYNSTAAGSGEPDEISIAPVIGDDKCGATDSVTEIDYC
jgi:hypothetical protein